VRLILRHSVRRCISATSHADATVSTSEMIEVRCNTLRMIAKYSLVVCIAYTCPDSNSARFH
jgi:hypothetical protein